MANGYRATVLALLAVLSLSSNANPQPVKQLCRVTVTTPQMGEKLGPDVSVEGRAAVPPGHMLWAFAHRRGLAIWWPQGGRAVRVGPKGEYTVLASLGGPDDVGAEFEIIVQVVTMPVSQQLDAWFKYASETGIYQGIPLPPVVGECGEPPSVTVVKAR